MIHWRGEDSRHAFSGDIANGFFGERASSSCQGLEGRQSNSAAFVACGYRRGDEPRRRGEDRRHGSRQTLRDWVHRFNETGPDDLLDAWASGPTPRLSPGQKAELAAIVAAGPDRKVDGVVRWRRIDLQRVIRERFGVACHERHVGTLLHQLGFSHMSARPRHPGQNAEIIEAFKKKLSARVKHPSG